MKASAPLKTAARRPCVVVVVVVVATTPNYLRQASQNLGKYVFKYGPILGAYVFTTTPLARACGVPAAVCAAGGGGTPQQAICRSKGAERVKGR